MHLGGAAKYLTEINERSEIAQAVAWGKENNLPIMMIGNGSNIIWPDEGFYGLVLVNRILHLDIYKLDESNAFVTAGAGEKWDDVVAKVVEQGYSGVEQLSLIPGTAGATPVQNVGAYGREISEVLTTIEAYDCQTDSLVTIRASECNFEYRNSRFKTYDRGRFFITAITFRVTKTRPIPPFYSSITEYFKNNGISEYTAKTLREAVIAIRSAKLPDPSLIPNNGSFFENPIVSKELLLDLLETHRNLVYWPRDDGGAKLSAAWLIEQTGFKGIHDAETGFATWPSQPLVIVNENSTKTSQLMLFKKKIVDAVQNMFGLTLVQEPELITNV